MKYPAFSFSRLSAGIYCLVSLSVVALAPAMFAQTSIPLFSGPVNVRTSASGTGFGTGAVNFNSNNLNLSCSASPIQAVLSSTPDSTGYLLVDNNVNVSVTSGLTTTGPTNVCVGGVLSNDPSGPFENCYSPSYQVAALNMTLTGQDPDNFVSTGGVPPIDISSLLVLGNEQVTIALQDEGGFLASSTLYLNTNCSQNGVTGPAQVTGNPIPMSGPSNGQLTQDFSFNPVSNQQIGFEYDLSAAQSAGSLAIQDQTIPQVADAPLDPAIFASQLVPGTSFSTSSCLIHAGELLPSGQSGCKIYTLECTVGTGNTASGAQCPVSSQANEIVQDVFDGPAFTLSDIVTPNGTFHEGIGLIMASESWLGGPCIFDTAADLAGVDCPQNLLTSFTSGGTESQSARKMAKLAAAAAQANGKSKAEFSGLANPRPLTTSSSGTSTNTGSGRTSRPNSTFISIAQVPEDLTTVTVAGQLPGYWVNTSMPSVTLSSQPPNLAGSLIPGAATFVPSPIQSITYGISPASSVPPAGNPVAGDVTLTNASGCPTPPDLLTPTASVFTPGQFSLQSLPDGNYLVHYFAQDCAGTQELHFTQDVNGNWSTGFYTYPINIDTTAPVVSSGPTLSPAASAQGTYMVGQQVSANYSCTDALSGVVKCGSFTYAVGATNGTGALTTAVDTTSPGLKTFTVQAVDAAGNTATASVNYQVVSPYDSQIQFSINPQTVTFPQGANVVVQILPPPAPSVSRRAVAQVSKTPTGTVTILDGTKVIETLKLQGGGAAYGYIQKLNAGLHTLSVSYSGDANDPSGVSAPVTFTVQPAPVTLGVACWNPTFAYGANYFCNVHVSSSGGTVKGEVTYSFDNGAPITSPPLQEGGTLFAITKPIVGQHTLVVSYAAQTNFAAATPQPENFTVLPAPVYVAFTPSSWYLTGGTLKLTATVESSSAGSPHGTGAVTFTDGSKVLGVVNVNSYGVATLSVAATALSNGTHTFTAAYAGGTNYGTNSTSIQVTVAHP